MTQKQTTSEKLAQQAAVTQYLVQVETVAVIDGEERDVWLELGTYEAPSGNRRSAIQQAMERHGLEEGSFHTIPESSAMVETCRVKKTISWE
jgi:hypothetical protein